MFKNILHIRLVALFVLAFVQASWCVPYHGFGPTIRWEWDDSTGSGAGDIDEAPVRDPWYPANTEKNAEFEKPLPKSEMVFPGDPSTGKTCNRDQNCDNDHFCHENYKYCLKKRYAGELCRRTGNCFTGSICMWGTCHKEKRPGVYKSRCKMHNDCEQGLCCARDQGESICKPYLKEGQNCSAILGGLKYSMDHDCSCGFGLSCKLIGWSFSKPLMKCTKLLP